MIKLPHTLSFRLTLWYATAFVGFLAAALAGLYWSVSSVLDARLDGDLEEDVAELRLLYETHGIERVKQEIDREAGTSNIETFLRLVDVSGKPLYSAGLLHWEPDQFHNFVDSGQDYLFRTSWLEQQEYPTRIIYGYLSPAVIIQIGETLEEKAEIMEVLFAVFAMMFLVAVPLASLVCWLMARRAIRGIQAVSRASVDIQKGEFDQHVPLEAQHEEIQELVDTFNAMADRIRILMAEMREMIDNIAHDLRSPLARIKVISESALSTEKSAHDYRSSIKDTLKECDRLIKMVNTTLDVAEVEASVSYGPSEPVDLSELVTDVCDLFDPLAEEKDIEISNQVEPACITTGNKQTLQRMLANLLDNAIKYTNRFGSIKVDLVKLENKFFIQINDSGVGIGESEIDRIFQRFYRGDNSRSNEGCGLGLSYSRAVARMHGGDISVDSIPGAGTTFSIQLNSNK